MTEKTHMRAADSKRGRVYHYFKLPLSPVLGRIRALCGARLQICSADERTDHLHGCFRCDERKRASK